MVEQKNWAAEENGDKKFIWQCCEITLSYRNIVHTFALMLHRNKTRTATSTYQQLSSRHVQNENIQTTITTRLDVI